jgi:hypothetical protein
VDYCAKEETWRTRFELKLPVPFFLLMKFMSSVEMEGRMKIWRVFVWKSVWEWYARRMRNRFVVAVFGHALGSTLLHARLLENWPFERLTKEATIIVVIEPLSNQYDKDTVPGTLTRGVVTTFKVLSYFKGSPHAETILVRHFVYDGGVPGNGGKLINFARGPLDVDVTAATKKGRIYYRNYNPIPVRWLAFLKGTPDGSFIPVSGQQDPDFSFQELHDVSTFDSTQGLLGSELGVP